AGAVVADSKHVDGHHANSVSFGESDHLVAAAIQILPALALFDHRLQVFVPDHAVLDGIFDDGAGEGRGEIGGAQLAVAEIAGHGEAAVNDGDGLGGG